MAERDGVVVFVEVKERHGDGHGRGFEAVTRGKRLRVIQAARLYASRFGLTEARLRFDVISIDWRDGKARGPPRRGRVRRVRRLGFQEGVGAGNGIRTRDIDLGKVALYH